MKTDTALDSYFAEAQTWDRDRVALKARSERIAWLVAGAGWLCAILASLALTLLTPLKRVEPFVVRVDNSTGVVDVVPVYSGGAAMPEVFTRYLLTHYVTVCERFNFATAESDYQECGAFNSAQRNQAWYGQWNTSNPASPLNLYKDGTTLHADVTSVSFFQKGSGVSDLAQIRYVKAKRAAGSAEPQLTHWIATIQYVYGEPSKDPKVRRWNPLGLKIIDYRPEPEVVGEAKAPERPSLMKQLILLGILGLASGAHAAAVPARGVIDARIRTAAYNAEQVYRLAAVVGYQIDLEFAPGESYVGIGGGDLEGVTLGAFDNHLLLKPKAVNVGTNLTVFTNRRHYHFDYSATMRRPDPEEVIYAVHFTYPPVPASGPTAEERINSSIAQAQSQRARNIDYWFCGDETIKPVAASDDGVHTRLTFGAKVELPAIFVRNDDASESLLNFSIEDGDVILHRVARQFVLRRGKLVGCITNKGFVGGGERLQSGTIAPNVNRARRDTP